MVLISIKRLATVVFALALTFPVVAAEVAAADPLPDPPLTGCRIIKDDGSWFIDRSVQGCNDYYPAGHACGGPHRTIGSYACALQDRIKGVDPAAVDMIINAHRGVWGLALNDSNAATNPQYDPLQATIGGPAENSLEGLKAASEAGFQTVEFDVFLVRQDTANQVGWDAGVYVTHFTDYAGFTDYRNAQVTPKTGIEGAQGYLMATPKTELDTIKYLKLRDRDGVVTNSTLMPLRDFVTRAVQRGMLVVLDIKFAKALSQTRFDGASYASKKIGFDGAYPSATRVAMSACRDRARNPVPLSPEDQTLRTITGINKELGDLGDTQIDYRAWVVIKFPQSSIPCPNIVRTRLGDPDFEKLLFAPGPDANPPSSSSSTTVFAYTTDYVQEWMSVGPRTV